MKNNSWKKFLALTAGMACITTTLNPVNVMAANVSVDVSTSTFKEDTDNSADFIAWKNNVWQGGEKQFADSGKLALTPGSTSADLNFAWYSKVNGVPAVKVWKKGSDEIKIVTGDAKKIEAKNWQDSSYVSSNKVSISGFFEEGAEYGYQYSDDYVGAGSEWSETFSYSCKKADAYSVILTGDPQVGASGSSSDTSATDSSIARDTYNWDLTMSKALELCPDAAFLLSAGDQIDKNGTTADNRKTRESEYAGYLYPNVFRSLPIASTIGNHDRDGYEYSLHFNNPNSSDELGATEAGSDYYFSYGDVLYISINSNNRNQEEHRSLMSKAIASNPNAKWKVVIFHSDIYGSGQPHADTDAVQNRIVLAPLMDEFDIDIVLTGHDHTYSRSYQILDGNVIDYDISEGFVTNPDGTLYITTGSGSGSKYYNLLNYTPYYIADRSNVCLPAFSVIDFTDDSLTIKTYDYNGDKYAEDFTINKTEDTVDSTISNVESLLANGKEKYTEDSLAALDAALLELKSANDTYQALLVENATPEDLMLPLICTTYTTADDVISGYGSVRFANDKDGSINRFVAGKSSLLDKTVYSQVVPGMQAAMEGLESLTEDNKSALPVISATGLEIALEKVNEAVAALEEVEIPADEDDDIQSEDPQPEDPQPEDDEDQKDDEKTEVTTTPEQSTTDNKVDQPAPEKNADVSPKTGDNTAVLPLFAALIMAVGAFFSTFISKKGKEE